LIRGPGPDKVD